ncbi:MAG: Gfo/Idh/MocA family oxidoreductase [Candidatus Solibacter usitatus]|nr:Gfo/Idh/MocA family oxidoreductase [Candidatus Solibacter usitatus]
MEQNSGTRRDFVKAGSAATLAAGFPAILSSAPVANALRVGLVGCGGRGTGAAAQALRADDYAELTAVGDVYQERIDTCLGELKKATPDKLKLEAGKQFVGLDAYQKVIASGVDVVLLATPPGFRPMHLRAAIEAGKHVFCEKPIAVDSFGVRDVLETAKLARQKNVSLVAGFCWRYSNYIKATFQEIMNGAIGDIAGYYATYYTSPVKPMPPASTRPAGMSDVEWQIKNWYNFTWTCGDSLVEQAVHSADKIAWAMGDQPPLSCVGVGGRSVPAEGGNIFDHFEINYLYANGARAFLASRQIEGCHNENSDYILGAEGACTLGRGPVPRIEGKNPWTFSGKQYNMYQREHDLLFASIRRNQPMNDGRRMTTSTLLAMMGRMAAYTGQQVTWDQAMNSQERLVPETLDWAGSLPVQPRAEPGITKFA